MKNQTKKTIAGTLCIVFFLSFVLSLGITFHPELLSKQSYDILEYFMLMVLTISLLTLSALYGEMWLYTSNKFNKYFKD